MPRSPSSYNVQHQRHHQHQQQQQHHRRTNQWVRTSTPLAPPPRLPALLNLHRRAIKAAASGRHYPEPLRAPLPIGSMRDAAVHTTQSPPPKGVPPAARTGIVVAASAAAALPVQAANLLPNKMRGREGHLSSVAALAGMHSSEGEPVSETFKSMVRQLCKTCLLLC